MFLITIIQERMGYESNANKNNISFLLQPVQRNIAGSLPQGLPLQQLCLFFLQLQKR